MKIFTAMLALLSVINLYAQAETLEEKFDCKWEEDTVTIAVTLKHENYGFYTGRSKISGYDSRRQSPIDLNLWTAAKIDLLKKGLKTNGHYWFQRGNGEVGLELIHYANPETIEGQLLDRPITCTKT